MSDTTPGSLEEQALKRRQKLLSLKRKREGRPEPDDSKTANPENELETLPKPIFRSYVPLDDKLQDSVITDIRPEDITEQVCVLFCVYCAGIPETFKICR